MLTRFNKFIDRLSDYFAHRKGLLPFLGIALIIINFVLQFSSIGWLRESDLFLHLGAVIAILGFMVAWAL